MNKKDILERVFKDALNIEDTISLAFDEGIRFEQERLRKQAEQIMIKILST